MVRRKTTRKFINIIMIVVCVSMVGSLATGCRGSKKCGCGEDLNGVYTRHKRNW